MSPRCAARYLIDLDFDAVARLALAQVVTASVCRDQPHLERIPFGRFDCKRRPASRARLHQNPQGGLRVT
jgi:hypothetical protein